jgi:two-component system response regulator
MGMPTWMLIADDDPNDRFLIGKIMRESDVDQEIIFAKDGTEVFKALRGEPPFEDRPYGPPAVVILDHQMPGVSGLEILRRIRSDPDFELIPVVMHSGQMRAREIREAYRLGANAYVEKPVSYEGLKKVFKELGIFWGQVNVVPV